MTAADHVTVYWRTHENRRSPITTKAIWRTPRIISSTTIARVQQTAESSNEPKQSTGNEGFASIAQNVKRSLDAENGLTDTQHHGPHKPLLFDGLPLRSDTQQYAYNSRLIASDTGDGDGHQTHYTQVIKYTNESGQFFDEKASLLKGQIAAGDHHRTETPPMRRGKIIRRRPCPIRKRSESNQRGEYTNRQGARGLQRPTTSTNQNGKHQSDLRSNREMANLHRKIKTSESSQTSADTHDGNVGGSSLENSYVAASDKIKLPVKSTAVRAINLMIQDTNIMSSTATEKNVLFDVTNALTLNKADRQESSFRSPSSCESSSITVSQQKNARQHKKEYWSFKV